MTIGEFFLLYFMFFIIITKILLYIQIAIYEGHDGEGRDNENRAQMTRLTSFGPYVTKVSVFKKILTKILL